MIPVLVGLLLHARSGVAGGQAAPRPERSLRLQADNDFLALRGGGPTPDFDYTHGTRISLAWPRAPARVARLLGASPRCPAAGVPGGACLLSGLALAQEIYTPRHDRPTPVPGDRPYAAWLYGAAVLQRLAGSGLHTFELDAGVTGPAALGKPVQNGVHRLLHSHLRAGWSHQLPARLAVSADYDGTRLLMQRRSAAPSRFVAGSFGATMGTVRRAVRAGASAHLGFGPARTPTADAPLVRRPGRFYVAAGYEQSFVLYDAFIEGTTATRGATRLPWVGEAAASLGWRVRGVVAEYRYVSRAREYRAQPARHAYGSVTLSVLLP